MGADFIGIGSVSWIRAYERVLCRRLEGSRNTRSAPVDASVRRVAGGTAAARAATSVSHVTHLRRWCFPLETVWIRLSQMGHRLARLAMTRDMTARYIGFISPPRLRSRAASPLEPARGHPGPVARHSVALSRDQWAIAPFTLPTRTAGIQVRGSEAGQQAWDYPTSSGVFTRRGRGSPITAGRGRRKEPGTGNTRRSRVFPRFSALAPIRSIESCPTSPVATIREQMWGGVDAVRTTPIRWNRRVSGGTAVSGGRQGVPPLAPRKSDGTRRHAVDGPCRPAAARLCSAQK